MGPSQRRRDRLAAPGDAIRLCGTGALAIEPAPLDPLRALLQERPVRPCALVRERCLSNAELARPAGVLAACDGRAWLALVRIAHGRQRARACAVDVFRAQPDIGAAARGQLAAAEAVAAVGRRRAA